MRIVIIGCTLSTRRFIEEILRHDQYKIASIITLKDSMAYKKSRFVLLDDIAKQHNIEIHKTEKINDAQTIKYVESIEPDLIIESGWSLIIPKEILKAAKKGCIGIHCSYLPKNQGAASLNWAIINKEKKWGVTLFYLEEKIDAGDIIDQREFNVEERDDINTIFDKADYHAIEMLRQNLPLIIAGKPHRKKQDPSEVTYLKKRKPEDGKIDWSKPANDISRLIRALKKPYPGAFTFFNGKKILVWEAKESSLSASPGVVKSVLNGKGIEVGCGANSLLIERIQLENGIEMWADEFAMKNNIKENDKFE